MSTATPLTPEQIAELLITAVPDFVIQIVNEMLLEKAFQTNKSDNLVIEANELINRINKAKPEVTGPIAFNKGYLNIQPAFEKKGWVVTQNKDVENLYTNSTYTFNKKRRGDY